MATITLTNLTKRFDDVTAVNGIDLRVRDGEFLVVVGPSGCGKSTTLRLVSGLESPTSGRVRIGGEDVTTRDPADRDVAFVFQNYALYPHMTAQRNMTFGMGSATEFDDETVQRRVTEAAETLDITDLLDRKPDALSGGERQRVALGRAIVRDPDVFLMDEPLSNLDAKLRVRMRAELAQLHEDIGTTTVYVTHDQTEAMTLGDRVVVMNDGRIQQVAPPQQLYDYPANEFVAAFIGDPAMNLLDVGVADGGDRPTVVHEAFELGLPDDPFGGDPPDAVRFGVRPEDVTRDPDGPLTATATVTEPLGDALLVTCRVGDDAFKVSLPPRSAVDPGDEVSLAVERDRLHLFDAGTGEALYHSGRRSATDAEGAVGEAGPGDGSGAGVRASSE